MPQNGQSIPFQRSCLHCYGRKVKCDRFHPCVSCVKRGETCAFPTVPIRRNRNSKQQSATSSIAKDPGSRDDYYTRLPALDYGSHVELFSTFIPQQQAKQNIYSNWMPTPDQLRYCWETYVLNIDPFVKILHKPSMSRLIQRVQCEGFAVLGIEDSALVLAICFSAVTSMQPDQCREKLGRGKDDICDQMKRSAELAIDLAELSQKPDIRTLQAFTLALVCKIFMFIAKIRSNSLSRHAVAGRIRG
jgi:hypothetical protein